MIEAQIITFPICWITDTDEPEHNEKLIKLREDGKKDLETALSLGYKVKFMSTASLAANHVHAPDMTNVIYHLEKEV